MLMTAVHMDSTTQPWLPVLTDHHHHHHIHDLTPAALSASSSTPPPAPSPSSSHSHSHSHHHARLLPRAAAPARRRAAKRRPRPSRRLPPTTYISADPASFRRMVHQVTGADDLPLPAAALPRPNAAEILLTRPAPVRAGGVSAATSPGGAPNTLLLPTLDTSAAFLVGALSRTRRPDDGSGAVAAAAPAMEAVEAGGACSSSSGGFPTLESWDHHALF